MAREQTREPGWVASILGAVVLIAGGFLVGLVVGVVSEEPDLVVEHIAGGSEEVDWDVATATPDVASPPRGDAAQIMPGVMGASAERAEKPPPRRVARAVVEPPPPVAPAPEPRRALPPPPTAEPLPAPAPAAPVRRIAGGYSVQVGAFGESGSARRLAGKLEALGFQSYVTPGAGDGRWRVRVGPVASRKEADALAARLDAEQGLPTWVLSEGAN